MCVEQIHAALLTDLEGIKGPQQVMRANTYGSKITLSYCRKVIISVLEIHEIPVFNFLAVVLCSHGMHGSSGSCSDRIADEI